MAAVHGGTYVLGRRISSTALASGEGDVAKSRFRIVVDGLETPIYTTCIIGALEGLSSLSTDIVRDRPWVSPFELLRGVLILDRPPQLTSSSVSQEVPSTLDTFMVVMPPGAVEGSQVEGSVTFLITGEGSQSTPRGKCEFLLFLS